MRSGLIVWDPLVEVYLYFKLGCFIGREVDFTTLRIGS